MMHPVKPYLLFEDARYILEYENNSHGTKQKFYEAAIRLAKHWMETRCGKSRGWAGQCGRDQDHDGPCAVFPNCRVCNDMGSLEEEDGVWVCSCEAGQRVRGKEPK